MDCGADPPSSTSSRRVDASPPPRGHRDWAVPAARVSLAGAGRRRPARRHADRRLGRPSAGAIGRGDPARPRGVGRVARRFRAARADHRGGPHRALDHARPGGRPRPSGGSAGWGRAVVHDALSRVGSDHGAGRAWCAPERSRRAPPVESRLESGSESVRRRRDDRRRPADLPRRHHGEHGEGSPARRGSPGELGGRPGQGLHPGRQDAARGPARRGAHLQSRSLGTPRAHRRHDRRASRSRLDRAPDRDSRGRRGRSFGAVCRAWALVLRGMDRVRAGLGRT